MSKQQSHSGSVSRLALSCTALARAGQVLSAVLKPEQADAALLQAAEILSADDRLAAVEELTALAQRCQQAAGGTAPDKQVSTCRELATAMARQSSSLATAVQQRSKGTVAKGPQTAPAPVAKPPSKPAPQPKAEPAAAPKPKPRPAPRPEPVSVRQPKATPATARTAPAVDIRHLTIAVSGEEKAVVTAALQAGKRFARLDGGCFIDTQTNRMWAARLGPPGNYAFAQRITGDFNQGGYANWRMPSPEELQSLFVGGASVTQAIPGFLAPETGACGDFIWSAQSRLKYFFFGREAVIIEMSTGRLHSCKGGNNAVHVLPVRSP